jgi:hypothetical protein
MIVKTDVRESVTWTASGLALEARCPFEDCFSVTVRHVGSAPVVWSGEFPARGRTLNDLPDGDFTAEVLARVVREQADRLDRLVYAQDDLRTTLREIATAIPESYRS